MTVLQALWIIKSLLLRYAFEWIPKLYKEVDVLVQRAKIILNWFFWYLKLQIRYKCDALFKILQKKPRYALKKIPLLKGISVQGLLRELMAQLVS